MMSGARVAILEASAKADVTAADVDKYIKTFDELNIQAIKLENSYNTARTATENMIASIEELLFLVENKQKVDVVAMLGRIGRGIKEAEGWEVVMPCCLTNGSEGYFPMQDSYDEGGYEARSSRYKAGTAEMLIEEGVALLGSLR